MAAPQYPPADRRRLIGKRIDRLDGPVKSTGRAKYAYDINRPGMLYARTLHARHALAKVEAIDTSAAKAMPGVATVWLVGGAVGKQIEYAGEILGAVAAETEEIAAEAVSRIVVTYTVQKPQVMDNDLQFAADRENKRDEGDVEAAFAAAAKVTEGQYGIPVITHCCLEAHGQVTEMRDNALYIWPSTQNVSKYADGLGNAVDVAQSDIHVECQYMGGGFGSKFSNDQWGVIGAKLAQITGKPVKLMLERDAELMIAGNRPSAYGTVKVATDAEGRITAFDAVVMGTGGTGGYNPPPLPYVFTKIPNQRMRGRRIPTNRGTQRAWRAPGHPQGCLLTMAALDDAAAALGMDPLAFFKKNLDLTDRADLYARELDIAAQMIRYSERFRPRGEGAGTLRHGIGLSIHQWGGQGHPSECEVVINPDGSVEARIGTQDLGTGTRTCIAIVLAETMGLPLDAVTVKMGRNEYPQSGASGGSTTIGGVTASTRLAATAALNALFEAVASRLGAT
ncbi:MAG: molybdopterin-dependent oxidoreductase, partial [Anaerolineae bacterium]|nr:molybdopterin-dependent oxidoreductase [Anaerolineae bacterium]